MRRPAWAFLALLAGAMSLSTPATGCTWYSRPPETLTRLITRLDENKSPHVVGLVRVLSVDSVALDNAAFMDTPKDSVVAELRRGLPQPRRRLSRLEVVEWLRRGLDGDEIEVGMLEGGLFDERYQSLGRDRRGARARMFELAGVDTMGALVFLSKLGHGWVFDRGISESFLDGFRPVPQREFKAYRDSVLRGRKKTP
jgi:hypothetical protein